MHEQVDMSTLNSTSVIGSIDNDKIGFYIDYGLLLVFGGIPWQVHMLNNCNQIKIN